jgi:cysteine desulfurase / selenocysteine lyase
LTFDVEGVRAEFPILSTASRGKPLVYLDSAATAQKPQVVIDALRDFYQHDNANIHRGVYQLSERATLAWDAARDRAASFVGATDSAEIVFVRGTTEAINLVAHSFLKPRLSGNGTVLVTEMEHHANIVPWQLAGATTIPIPVSDAGELDLVAAERMLSQGPSLLAVTHVSNTLGTINPIAALSRMAHGHGVPVLVDGAQAAPHLPINVAELGCDFYAFSSHKTFGPTGIGALWARRQHLEAMPPYQGGGDMIDLVTFERTTFAEVPRRFEAGTPHIAGAVGLAAALTWIGSQDRAAVQAHEHQLMLDASEQLSTIPGLRLVGTAPCKAPVITFALAGAHPHDVASLLDGEGICVRAGHHCTQPLHQRLGLPATVRASFAPFNTHGEVDALARGLHKVRKVFA